MKNQLSGREGFKVDAPPPGRVWTNRRDDRCTGADIVQGIPHCFIKKDEEVSLRKLREGM